MLAAKMHRALAGLSAPLAAPLVAAAAIRRPSAEVELRLQLLGCLVGGRPCGAMTRAVCLDLFFSMTELGGVGVVGGACEHDVVNGSETPFCAVLPMVKLHSDRRAADFSVGCHPLALPLIPLPNS